MMAAIIPDIAPIAPVNVMCLANIKLIQASAPIAEIAVKVGEPYVLSVSLCHHHHWAALVSHGNDVVGRRPQHAVSKLACIVLYSAISCRSRICAGRLSTAWLVSLVIFSCRMVSKCPSVQDHFIFSRIANYVYDFCVLSLTHMLTLLPLYLIHDYTHNMCLQMIPI